MKILNLALLFAVVCINGMDRLAGTKRKKPEKDSLNVEIEEGGTGNISTGPSLSQTRPDIANGW